ncbi:MAG: TonB-dependent receptor [Ferruginibacter sp.]|uniref:carboxypeptidase-like regulatory domain-containing protein n=1 Tax=Ferruginibacter sp. TaxID=1940288 RepID=UPI0026595CCE|nr:carboxypeptidase-like regulatory domain-containing protein [Ferruginibacter sp.]MDB5277357.1 TonB-dependent receptor [Ferruginibacter sp.]
MLTRTRNIVIKSFLAFSLSFFSQFLLAQKTGKVTGRVFDKDIPLEFVTVTIFNQADTGKVAYYATTDTSGSFIIDPIEFGKYIIKFSLIGYKPSAQNFSVTATAGTIKFENYKLNKDVKLSSNSNSDFSKKTD